MTCLLSDDFVLSNYTKHELKVKFLALDVETTQELVKKWLQGQVEYTGSLKTLQDVYKKYHKDKSQLTDIIVEEFFSSGITAGQWTELDMSITLQNIGSLENWTMFKLYHAGTDFQTAKFITKTRLAERINHQINKAHQVFHFLQTDVPHTSLCLFTISIFHNYLQESINAINGKTAFLQHSSTHYLVVEKSGMASCFFHATFKKDKSDHDFQQIIASVHRSFSRHRQIDIRPQNASAATIKTLLELHESNITRDSSYGGISFREYYNNQVDISLNYFEALKNDVKKFNKKTLQDNGLLSQLIQTDASNMTRHVNHSDMDADTTEDNSSYLLGDSLI